MHTFLGDTFALGDLRSIVSRGLLLDALSKSIQLILSLEELLLSRDHTRGENTFTEIFGVVLDSLKWVFGVNCHLSWSDVAIIILENRIDHS